MNKLTKDYYFRSCVYCFKKMPDGRYLPLNRDYLPLDRTRGEVGGRLDDSSYDMLLENAHKEIGVKLSLRDIKLIRCTGNEEKFWLFTDESAPWRGVKHMASYEKKRELLPQLKWLT